MEEVVFLNVFFNSFYFLIKNWSICRCSPVQAVTNPELQFGDPDQKVPQDKQVCPFVGQGDVTQTGQRRETSDLDTGLVVGLNMKLLKAILEYFSCALFLLMWLI